MSEVIEDVQVSMLRAAESIQDRVEQLGLNVRLHITNKQHPVDHVVEVECEVRFGLSFTLTFVFDTKFHGKDATVRPNVRASLPGLNTQATNIFALHNAMREAEPIVQAFLARYAETSWDLADIEG